ncbi:MAG: hypothetical protein LBU42_00580 [Prevotellaceae bacterium]|jgi:hypothetical protein|nr:hypothetical protein [Prevotellaceae bacterium]
MKLGIKKIEYRHKDDKDATHWAQLNIVQFSCTLSEEWAEEPAGKVSTVTIQAELRHSSEQNDSLLLDLLRNQTHYRVIDMNGYQYIIGDAGDYLPRLTWKRSIEKLNPNGYKIKITYRSPNGIIAA